MKYIKNKIIKLRKKINYHSYLYNILNTSEINDFEYDLLINELIELEKKFPSLVTLDSPTRRVGEKPSNLFQKINYETPMLSLNNVFNEKGFINFYNNIKDKLKTKDNIELCCELKIDGVAISLLYKDGILIRGSTRGNGNIGENITSNVKSINSIPSNLLGENLPKFIEVRGEIFIKKKNFYRLNNEILNNKGKIFSNERNAASGLLRQIKISNNQTKFLSFFCYGIGFLKTNKKLKTQSETLKIFKSWGLPVNNVYIITSSYEEIFNFYNKIQNKRYFLDFHVDGIVIKINSFSLQKKLGTTYRAYKWAIAYKFIAEEQTTLVNDINFQVGRTGIITPVAYLKPVKILGVMVSKATLHNVNEIKKLGININDMVLVKRAGDVIPKIINVIRNESNQNICKITIPKYCPSCNSLLEQYPLTGILRCNEGINCKAQKIALLKHFVSKNAMNIKGIGNKLINNLVEKKYVLIPSDFFDLTENQLINLNRIGLKLAKNIINSLKESKIIKLSSFIYSLGIYEVGEITAINLANYFGSIEDIMNAEIKKLILVPNIGNKIAYNVYEYMNNKNNHNMIIYLIKKIGIKLLHNKTINYKNYDNKYFIKKNIVLTGSFMTFTKNEIKNILTDLGAQIKTCVSKKTNLLIFGKSTGLKLIKAKELKIKIISEIQLKDILNKIRY